jgi:trehalose 6-phosphate phosphatase
MKHLLSRGNRAVLRQFAWSNVLLAFDFDGTLAPIVSDPDRAAMRARTRALLQQVARQYPCVVISGRAHADAQRRLRGVDIFAVFGNHGVEPWAGTQRLVRQVEAWVPRLRRALAPFSGIWVENKTYSIAIHYRHCREKRKARAAILKAAAALGPLRIIGGKQVVNLLPAGAPHKGTALERERERLKCDTAIYVGDDETDEDVFALEEPGRLLTVRVGASKRSMASYHLKNQSEIDALLRALVDVRRGRPSWHALRSRSA